MRGERDILARAKVLAALRAGSSVLAAAKAAGISRQAIYLWREKGDDELDALLSTTRAQRLPHRASPDDAPTAVPPMASAPIPPPPGLTDEDVMRLRKLGLGTLAALAKDADAPASARATAARALMEHGERWARSRATPAGVQGGAAVPLPADDDEDAGAIITRIMA